VFNLKSDSCKKARLVAKGFSQVEGIDYNAIFLLVVWFKTVWLMIALTALKNWHITSLDVKIAFLYGALDEELYMEQPEGFKVKGHEGKVLCLKYAIYGLKQAALALSPSGHSVASFSNWVLYTYASSVSTTEDLLSQTTKSNDHIINQVT
jgi:hypothetical protein